MTRRSLVMVVILLAPTPLFGGAPKSNPDQAIDRIIANERALSTTMRNYSPMVETYLQRMQPDTVLGYVPSEDRYFLGRVQFQQATEEFYLDKRLVERMAGSYSKLYSLSPVGFSSMIFVRSHRLRPQELSTALHAERVFGRSTLPDFHQQVPQSAIRNLYFCILNSHF